MKSGSGWRFVDGAPKPVKKTAHTAGRAEESRAMRCGGKAGGAVRRQGSLTVLDGPNVLEVAGGCDLQPRAV
jgi:hypothetical protein